MGMGNGELWGEVRPMGEHQVLDEGQPDFPTRLRAFKQLTGMSNAEIARRIDAPRELIRDWQRGRLPRGLALLQFMALASRIPDGMDTMFPLLTADIRRLDEKQEKLYGA